MELLFSFFVLCLLLSIDSIGRHGYRTAKAALNRAKSQINPQWIEEASAKSFTEIPLEYVARNFEAYGIEIDAAEVFYNLEYLVTPTNMHLPKQAPAPRENTQSPVLIETPKIVQTSGDEFAGVFEFTDGAKECELIGEELNYKDIAVLQFVKTSWYDGLTITQIIGEGRKKGYKMPSERTILGFAAKYQWAQKNALKLQKNASPTS